MTIFRFISCSLILSLGTVISSAKAQDAETGSIIKKAGPAKIEDSRKGEEARPVVDAFARCLVSRRMKQIEAALDPALSETKQAAALLRNSKSECLSNGELRFAPSVIRSALCRALVDRKYRDQPAQFGALPFNFAEDFRDHTGQPFVPPHQLMLNFASCVLHKDPTAVRSIILNGPGNKKSDVAFATISPLMSACLPADQQFKFTKTYLTDAFAEVYYREAQGTTAASTGTEDRG